MVARSHVAHRIKGVIGTVRTCRTKAEADVRKRFRVDETGWDGDRRPYSDAMALCIFLGDAEALPHLIQRGHERFGFPVTGPAGIVAIIKKTPGAKRNAQLKLSFQCAALSDVATKTNATAPP